MKERPILFNGEMVRAILEGRKTQTRRVVKPQPTYDGRTCKHEWDARGQIGVVGLYKACIYGPYGRVGDRLWVRETFVMGDYPGRYDAAPDDGRPGELGDPDGRRCFYRATEPGLDVEEHGWSPSIHMPRWASRILLEVVDVRVERVQGITDEDAKAEGIEVTAGGCYKNYRPEIKEDDGVSIPSWHSPGVSFYSLWDSINNKHGFGSEVNPWVWVVTFKRIED